MVMPILQDSPVTADAVAIPQTVVLKNVAG